MWSVSVLCWTMCSNEKWNFFFLSSPGNVWSCETIAFHVTNIVGPLRRDYFSQFMSSFTSPLRRPKIKFYGGYRPAELHFGQNDTLARDTLARTLWPEWHFGQSDILAKDTLASVTLAGDTLTSDTLARVTVWPVTLWSEWHFGQSDTLASFSCFLREKFEKK